MVRILVVTPIQSLVRPRMLVRQLTRLGTGNLDKLTRQGVEPGWQRQGQPVVAVADLSVCNYSSNLQTGLVFGVLRLIHNATILIILHVPWCAILQIVFPARVNDSR